MLFGSLIVSLILLVCVNAVVLRSPRPALWVGVHCALFTVGPFCMMAVFPAVIGQAVLLCALLGVLLVPERGRRLYFPLSLVATAIPYGIVMQVAVQDDAKLDELREQYPFESLEARLPQRPANATENRISHADRLDQLEDQIQREAPLWGSRTVALRVLHDRSVDAFVNRPGFGVTRMIPAGNPEMLREPLPERPPVPQPDYLDPFVPPFDILGQNPRDWDSTAMSSLHDAGVLDFVNPRGFGYFKDRSRVAGFQRHAMTKVPDPTAKWSVAHLDLIGLVVHEQPVAYVSANLPRMNDVGTTPTRPLDEFEIAGLNALHEGEYLFARGTDDRMRMIGGLRAAKQCAECHGVARGTLLGAFSYGLRREQH